MTQRLMFGVKKWIEVVYLHGSIFGGLTLSRVYLNCLHLCLEHFEGGFWVHFG